MFTKFTSQNQGFLLAGFLLLLTWNLSQAQTSALVISEINSDNQVELTNTGTEMANAGSLWLCDFPAYQQVSNLTLICGDLMLAPGEVLVVSGWTVDAADSELGLYTSSSFGSPAAIIDYVEWGSSGHTRSTVAITAGIWSSGSFLPAFAGGQSLLYDGSDNSTAAWTADSPSLCTFNLTAGCDVDGGTIESLGSLEQRVVVANRSSGTISVIDSETNTNIGTYEMPDNGEPMYVVYSAINHAVLVGDYSGRVVSFDATDFSVNGTVDAGAGVFHMWLSPDEQQLWVNNELDKTISVIDPGNLTNITTFSIPDDLADIGYKPHDVIIMPDNSAAFVTLLGNFTEDYVVKYDATTFTETARVALGQDPHVSLTSANDKLYVASQMADELKVLNRSDLSEVTSISIPNAHGLGMANDGDYLYIGNIADGGTNATYTLDLATNTLVGDPVDAPVSFPHNYALSVDDETLFLTHSTAGNNQVSVYSLSPTPTLTTTVEVGSNPFGLASYAYIISTDALTICTGDGESDAFDVSVEGSNGTNQGWIITDSDGTILGLPASPPFDLEGVEPGVCLVWHIAYEDGLTGLALDANANDLMGCFSLSNPITVTRIAGETDGGTLTGGPFAFCVGDGVTDNIPADGITLTGNVGTNSAWVVTDEQGNILGLPPTFSAVDFDGAGAGTCLVWHLSFEDGLVGAEMGLNAADLQGCFSLSNPISVVRTEVNGGTLEGGPFAFCVGDGVADNIPADGITLTGNVGTNSAWVVTDEQGNILGLPPTFSAVDFDGAGTGTCLVWHLSFEDGLVGAEMGLNAADLQGCYSLSNPINVVRSQPEGGTLEGGPFAFCVGDGVADNIPEDGITLTGNLGANSAWVVTDEQGNILGLPPTFSAVDFDGAGAGTCLVWHLSFEDGLVGAEVGMNANDLQGCFSLSNPISVVRTEVNGGTLEGGPFAFCVGDGVADNIPEDGITLTGNLGANSAWVVTDEQGNILGLPPTFSAVDFDGAGGGTCLVWHLSFEDGLVGAEVGMNANDLQGCFSLSNPISVVRTEVNGGTLEGGPFAFCVGDGVADNIPEDGITLTGNLGANSAWVVTDEQGNILGLPPTFSAVDFDGAGAGTCLVWHLSFEDGLTGAEVGMNANDLQGCFGLSNPISVLRTEVNGGTLEGGPFTFCVGDGVADNIPEDGITLTGNLGANSAWVVTDEQGNILGLPPTFSAVDFDGAGGGTCLVWHLSFEDGLVGAEVGMNANDLQGCFSLSNPISVVRSQPEGGTLEGGPFTFCVGDGVADNIPDDGITLTGNVGTNSAWVVTDEQGNILGLPPTFSAVDFDGAGAGTCLVWHLSFEDGLTGAEVGMNANDLQGCFSLSNPISVLRTEVNGGTLEGGPFTFCVGDGVADNIPEDGISLSGNVGTNSAWVVTDEQGNILGLPPTFSAVDFDGAGAGTCLVWHLSFEDGLIGAEVGMNANDLEGCFSLSNPISVVRSQPEGGTLEGGPFEFCVGDGEADMIEDGAITLSGNTGTNSAWVITDEDGNILGLPPTYSDANFEDAGTGICLVWHLSFEDGLVGAEVGMNAADLQGCFSLSNPISVVRSQPAGGTLEGGPFEFCVGDGVADNIPEDGITLTGNLGANSAWVVTDEQGNILGLPPTFSAVDFDGAGGGTCLVWHLSFEDGLIGAEVGMNANDLEGCFSLSNPISVVRSQPEGGTLEGGPFEFCVGDGEADMIEDGAITLSGNTGTNSAWVITDEDGNILGLPPTYSDANFEDAGAGTCLVWHLSFEDGLIGAEVGMNANDLEGCFSLSNPITVERVEEGPLCIVSTEEVNPLDLQLNIWPNPAHDVLGLQIELEEVPHTIQVEIRSVVGQVVFTQTLPTQQLIREQLLIDQLPAGSYLLSIRTEKAITTLPFMKQ